MNEENNENIEVNEKEKINFNDENKIVLKKSTYSRIIIGLIVVIAVSTFFGGYFLGTLNNNSDSYVTSEDLETLILEMNANDEQRTQVVQQPTQPTAPPVIRVSLDDDPVKGNPNAPITIIEFSDFQCPFCASFFLETLPLIEENFIEKGIVKLVYRDFPIDSIHPNARPAHIASECADEQDKFWEYHDLLFEKQSEWNRLNSTNLDILLKQYASDLELQSSSFESCLNSPAIADEVNNDVLESLNYGVTGTPSFFIGNERDGFVKVGGAQPFSVFQTTIQSQLG